MKLCTPNIVVVFSNDTAEIDQLAHDRWKIFSIANGDLVEKPIPKPKSKANPNLKLPMIVIGVIDSLQRKTRQWRYLWLWWGKESYTLISKPRSGDQKTYFCLEESDIESSANDEKKTHTNSSGAFEEVKKSEDIVEYPLDIPKSNNMQKEEQKLQII